MCVAGCVLKVVHMTNVWKTLDKDIHWDPLFLFCSLFHLMLWASLLSFSVSPSAPKITRCLWCWVKCFFHQRSGQGRVAPDCKSAMLIKADAAADVQHHECVGWVLVFHMVKLLACRMTSGGGGDPKIFVNRCSLEKIQLLLEWDPLLRQIHSFCLSSLRWVVHCASVWGHACELQNMTQTACSKNKKNFFVWGIWLSYTKKYKHENNVEINCAKLGSLFSHSSPLWTCADNKCCITHTEPLQTCSHRKHGLALNVNKW